MTRIAITSGATAGNKRRAATHYGVREIQDKLPSKYAGSQNEQKLNYTFSFDDLPVAGLDEAILRIPANARILRATIRIITAFAGGTTYNFGLEEADGTTIDVDGIDAAVALTAMDGIGDVVLCDGDLVGTLVGIGAEPGQLVVAATGTYTAGKASLEIVYEELLDRA